MASQPKAYSTPNKILDIRKRRGIGEQEESIQSPIVNEDESNGSSSEQYANFAHESQSNSDSDHFEPSQEIDDINETRNNQPICGYWSIMGSIILMLSLGFLYLINPIPEAKSSAKTEDITIEELSHQFPSQSEDFWLSIHVAVNEINRLHKPRSVILLYQNDGMKTVGNILRKISQYAVCQISLCSSNPIDINGISLGETEILNDYGKVIVHNKEQLEMSGVMIVRNLENVPGTSAQAFHSLCDEYNPVVENALFLFTIKVESIQDSNMSFVEKHLRHCWSDLEDDKFYPLFTRITSTVLPVMKEN